MRSTLLSIGVAVAGILASAAYAGEKVVMNGKFGEVKQEAIIKADVPNVPELEQRVRVDQLTSNDAEWNGATITVYEHVEGFPSYGLFKIYGVLATKNGDQAVLEYAGRADVVTEDGKFAEAPFEAQGKILSGTGKLAKIAGTVVCRGKVTPDGGVYSIEIDAIY